LLRIARLAQRKTTVDAESCLHAVIAQIRIKALTASLGACLADCHLALRALLNARIADRRVITDSALI
jgi:hypothetical protein